MALMPLNQDGNCPSCGGCCTEPCGGDLECLYSSTCVTCCHVPVNPGPNLDIKAGTILAESSVDGLVYPYNPNGVDGLNMPRGIAVHDANTDDNGAYVRYATPFGVNCPKQLYMNMYIQGSFRTEMITGDLTAALPGFGRMITGYPNTRGTWLLT